MDSPSPGHILIVGDGDFSFTVSLVGHSSLVGTQVTASTLQTQISIEQMQLGLDNIKFLTNLGVNVLFETDACELHEHPVVSQKKYHRVIFNFPLSDRHNIKKNRALLADFFASTSQILEDEGQVFVTLCKGQGGTPADQPLRSWHDSWQVVAMAANSGFLMARVTPFNSSSFPGYHSTGFRFQDKSFNTEGALTHIFEKAETIQAQVDVKFRGCIKVGNISYSCSQYLVDKVSQNLLQKEGNPLCMLKKNLETFLRTDLKIRVIPDDPSWQVLRGHTSGAFFTPDQCKYSDEENSCLKKVTDEKDRKNETNRNLAMKTALLKHGLVERDETCGQDLGYMILDNPEAVFILLKSRRPLEANGDGMKPGVKGGTADGVSVTMSDPLCPHCIGEIVPGEETEVNGIYHLRSSLLENLKDLTSRLHSDDLGIAMSGQSFSQCPIHPDMLPSHHEMVVLLPVNRRKTNTNATNPAHSELCTLNSAVDGNGYESVVTFISCLKNIPLFNNHNIQIKNCSSHGSLTVKNNDQVMDVKTIFLSSDDNDSAKSTPTGIIFKMITGEETECYVVLLKLDTVVTTICNIPDLRLLHSHSPKFVSQFCYSTFPSKFLPFSLYPMKFAHDLSFWENGEFEETELYSIVRDIAGEVVVSLNLIDHYTDAISGRKSRCYRLYFTSYDRVLSYLTSWKLQSIIRLLIAQKLGVTLR